MTWWTDLYDDTMARWMLHRSTPEAGRQTRQFLADHGVLRAGMHVFDQGCGPGRLVAPLADADVTLEGVDLIPAYITMARERAQARGLDPDGFRVGDIGACTSQRPAHLVISWWTCLGYAPDDATNALPLARAHESLEPGGTYAIDTLHTPGVLRGFRSEITSETPSPDGPIHLRRRSRLDVEAGVLHNRWHWTFPDGRTHEVPTQVRLYMPHEWVRMLTEAGFEPPRCFGDLDGRPLDPDSPRLLLLARKRA